MPRARTAATANRAAGIRKLKISIARSYFRTGLRTTAKPGPRRLRIVGERVQRALVVEMVEIRPHSGRIGKSELPCTQPALQVALSGRLFGGRQLRNLIYERVHRTGPLALATGTPEERTAKPSK